MNKITFANKVDTRTSTTPEINKVTASTLNEVKTIVNETVDQVELNTTEIAQTVKLTGDQTIEGDIVLNGSSTNGFPLSVKSNSNGQGVKIIGRASDGLGSIQFYASNGTTFYGQIRGTSTGFSFNVDSSNFTGTLSASNLSGTNTGDQDLSGYLLNTTDTFTGVLTVSGTVTATDGLFSGNVTLQDNGKAKFGASGDLEIYHDGLNSIISDTGTGNLVLAVDDFRLQNSSQTANLITANTGAEVNLMFNAGTKLSTTNTGVTVTGDVSANAATFASSVSATDGLFSGNVTLQDNGKAKFGASGDLEIYHDGLNSIISDTGTGNLVLAVDDFRLSNSSQTANLISANTGAEVNLMFNAGTKLSTTNTGVTVTGDVSANAATFASSVTATAYKVSALNTAPASATATGTTGEIRYTADYTYVCTATNTWKRSALSTW